MEIIVGQGGGDLVNTNGSNIVGQGGGNIVGQGGGNASHDESVHAEMATPDGFVQAGGELNLGGTNIIGDVTLNGGILSGSGLSTEALLITAVILLLVTHPGYWRSRVISPKALMARWSSKTEARRLILSTRCR